MIKLSVVIVNYNTMQILKNCLESIHSLIENDCNEIIVIDNNSIDGSVDLIEKEFPRVKLIKNNENFGFGKANNQGMKQANGDFFLLLNSDTAASQEAIDRCLDWLESNPNVGILGCRLKNPNNAIENSCGMFYSLWNAVFGGMELNKIFNRFKFIKFHVPEYLLPALSIQETKNVDWVSGAFMLLRKDVFQQTFGFDENIFLYDEEFEWCYRVKKKGWKIVYFPLAEIVHIGKASSSLNNEIEINQRILSGKEYYFKKHFGKIKAGIFRTLIFISGILKLPIWFIIYICSGSKLLPKNRMQFQISSISWFFKKCPYNE